jgi:hypothetical protein
MNDDNKRQGHQQHVDDGATGPVQLEHMIGLGAKYPNSALMLTHSDRYHVKRYLNSPFTPHSMLDAFRNILYCSTDSLVAIENLNDPNDQKLLRGHDMEVHTCTTRIQSYASKSPWCGVSFYI